MKADDFAENDENDRTAVVNLADLRGQVRRKRDRHLLVRVQGSDLGQVIRLDAQQYTIGRHPNSDLWITEDGISRRHARIFFEKGDYCIEDLRSANGTFVQGHRINTQALHDGDLIQFGPSSVFRYSIADEDQETLLRQLYSASVTDSLTGAYNRDHFDRMLAAELSYARRHRTEVSLLLFDLDHFKSVNDTYGHPAGDAVLVEIARSVRKVLRREDVLTRYGGEEFAIILRAIALAGARAMAERLRVNIESGTIIADEHRIHVTASMGVSSLSDCAEPTPQELIAIADRRLYAAKHGGRNRVVASG